MSFTDSKINYSGNLKFLKHLFFWGVKGISKTFRKTVNNKT